VVSIPVRIPEAYLRASIGTGVPRASTRVRIATNPAGSRGRKFAFSRGFTLIEIILVLAVLATVLAVSAPSLGRFFRGRSLDSEAHRLLALTRHAQDRAVSEGIPMILWLDLDARRYGLLADPAWSIAPAGSKASRLDSLPLGTPAVTLAVLQDDPKARTFEVAEDLDIEVESNTVRTNTMGSLEIRESSVASRPMLRFQPDGFLPAMGPRWIRIAHRRLDSPRAEGSQLWIAPGPNRSSYVIWTNQPPATLW